MAKEVTDVEKEREDLRQKVESVTAEIKLLSQGEEPSLQAQASPVDHEDLERLRAANTKLEESNQGLLARIGELDSKLQGATDDKAKEVEALDEQVKQLVKL